jgi:hypothetical protein
MATVEDIREEIKIDIDDDSFSDDFIDRQINKAIKKTSSMVLLPVLEKSTAVNSVVGDTYLSLPDGFGHNLFHASTARGKITVLSSMGLMIEEFPLFGSDNVDGDIEFCCIAGTKIAIHPIPIEITAVRLFYHEWPAVLDEGDDVGVYIPGEDHQEDIINNFVLWRLHKKLEDGAEGALGNTNYHEAQFYKAVKAFGETITQGQSRPTPQRKAWGI